MAAINSITCVRPSNFSLNFNGNSPLVGQVWVTYNSIDIDTRFGICAEITDLTDEPSSDWSATTQYTDCFNCLINSNYIAVLKNCQIPVLFSIPVSGLTETQYNHLSSGGTIFLDYISSGVIQKGCFTISKITSTDNIQFSFLVSNVQVLNVTIETECESCITNNSIVAEVTNCDGGTTHYVLMSSTALLNHLISYTDGIDEFCGVIRSYVLETPSFDFVSDYGFREECEVCLQNVGVKYNLVNCIDSNITEVVWGSQLFVNGQVSNLSTNDGCFEVSGTTNDPVTTNLFLDFEPHSDCQSCIECSGVFYQYSLCGDGDNTIVGEILSYQVIPVNGVFWHPVQNAWCIRQTASNSASGVYDTFYSILLAPSDCESPTFTPQTWIAEECTEGFQMLVMTDDSLFGGEIIQTMWATNNLFCATAVGTTTPITTGETYYNSALNGSGTTLIYGDCQTCFDNTLVGVSTINCDTLELVNYDVPYLVWCTLTNYGGNGSNPFNNLCFSDINGNCRTILECPQTLSGNLITPVDTYFNCPTCRFFQPNGSTVSAGTEYTVCVICEDCCQSGTTVTVVRPPHPTWTRPNGDAVVLLNAVQLGGMFGLNS